MSTKKIEKRDKRKRRIRNRVYGTKLRPRLSVFRSNKHIFAQVIDDEKGITLLSVSDIELSPGEDSKVKNDISFKVGELLAKKALRKKIKKLVLDRSGYKYHGRVKAFTEGARKGGLEI